MMLMELFFNERVKAYWPLIHLYHLSVSSEALNLYAIFCADDNRRGHAEVGTGTTISRTKLIMAASAVMPIFVLINTVHTHKILLPD